MRLQLDLDESGKKALEKLMDLTDIRTHKDFFNHAISVVANQEKEKKEATMIDFSKVKEIKEFVLDGRDTEKYVSENYLQKENWVLLKIFLKEEQYWQKAEYGNEAHLRKYSNIIYVLGRIK